MENVEKWAKDEKWVKDFGLSLSLVCIQLQIRGFRDFGSLVCSLTGWAFRLSFSRLLTNEVKELLGIKGC